MYGNLIIYIFFFLYRILTGWQPPCYALKPQMRFIVRDFILRDMNTEIKLKC